jgi:hypothetical protein
MSRQRFNATSRMLPKRRNAILIGAALAAALAAAGSLGLAAVATNGFPARIAATLPAVKSGDVGHDSYFKFQTDHFYLCTPANIQRHSLRSGWPARCVQSKASEVKQVALIGDSHAEDLFIGLAEQLPDLNIVTYIQNALPSLAKKDYDEIFEYVLADPAIRVVVVAAYWMVRKSELRPGQTLQTDLARTVGALLKARKTVYLVDDTPAFPFDPRICKYEPRHFFGWLSRRRHCDFERSRFDAEQATYRPDLEAVLQKFPSVRLLETAGAFCDEQRCRMASDSVMLFRDKDHLTIDGARQLGRYVAPQLGGALSVAIGQ